MSVSCLCRVWVVSGSRPYPDPVRSYRETTPAASLRETVETVWQARTGARPHTQRVLPDGCMDLLVLGGDLVVAGPDTTAHLAGSGPYETTTGLRFRPGALPALLGVPAEVLRDRRVPLTEVLAPARRAVVGRIPDRTRDAHHVSGGGSVSEPGAHGDAAGDGDAARLGKLTLALRVAATEDLAPEPLPRPALRALARGMPAAELADRLGVTGRTLHRRCVATLGYGPAVARRVLRFRAASTLLSAGVPPAEAAARAGYADQPHLSREVRALAGVSPGALAPSR